MTASQTYSGVVKGEYWGVRVATWFQATKLCSFLKQPCTEGSPAFACTLDVQYINRALPNSCFKINLLRSHYLANCCGLYGSRVLFGRERLMEDISFVLISFANCRVERWLC